MSDVTTPPKYGGAAAIPLPTYDQSEKFEKEGVLLIPVTSSDNETPEVTQPVRRWKSEGTCLEFTLFFIGKIGGDQLKGIHMYINDTSCSVCNVQRSGLHFLLLPGNHHCLPGRSYCWARHSFHYETTCLRGMYVSCPIATGVVLIGGCLCAVVVLLQGL